MKNIVPRVGIEPKSLGLQASVLTVTPHRLPDIVIVPTLTCLCNTLLERPVQTITPLCTSAAQCLFSGRMQS